MKKIMDGNEFCSKIAYKFSNICSIYPITPASPMASWTDKLANLKTQNYFNSSTKIIEMQSEAGAAAAMHGALLTGSLTSTFTSSQGLLLMIPEMYKMAGEMLPGVIHVAARSLSTHALSIFGDHQDIYATRQTGFCMIASSNVFQTGIMSAVCHLSAISTSLPFLHFFDGFRTSHELNTIEYDEDDYYSYLKKLIDYKSLNAYKKRCLNTSKMIQSGVCENEDIYFQVAESKNKDYEKAADIVANYMKKVSNYFNEDFKPFNYYGKSDATNVIVAMGSVCDTIKQVIKDLNNEGKKVGLVEVHLYRPFSKKYLNDIIPKTVKNIAVLDRTKEQGSVGEPLYLDVLASVSKEINVVGGRYGLSSKNTTPADIKSIFSMLEKKLQNNFTISIYDDVTNLSLPTEKYFPNLRTTELKIYGYGSDGMVSASKDLLKIESEINDYYVQGYFQYDSKKSGGVTLSHLRISDKKIDAPYYVTDPSIISVSRASYLNKYNIVEELCFNGNLLINTQMNETELDKYLNNDVKKIIKERDINLYLIDASKIAYENNLNNKISIIMEACILKILKVMNFNNILIKNIEEKFKNKGNDIINFNINAFKKGLNVLKKINNNFNIKEEDKKYQRKNIFDMIENRCGDLLKVSDVLCLKKGQVIGGLSKLEKRDLYDNFPVWNKEKCIQCMQCSLVCPHAVIRPFVVDNKNKYAPNGKDLLTDKNQKFIIGISKKDCTNCGLCIKTCPTHALSMGNVYDDEMINYLFNNYENKKIYDKYTIKGSQMLKPKFEFAPSCAGCGETAYIKLLTQLLQDRLIIANATGCSSIYGGSIPCTPYSVSWATSLFEDNAEFGLGMKISRNNIRKRIENIMKKNMDKVDETTQKLFKLWIENQNDFEITKKIKSEISNYNIPKELEDLKDFLEAESIWCIGGDGWAYDIGFSGIDHVLSSNENINILILDTEVYSNTGGQASKSSHQGQVCEFTNLGKTTPKKDLFKISMCYDNVYVALVSLKANFNQTLNAFKEAINHNGPSIIIAYSPCIEMGIKGGLSNSIDEEKLAVECGYIQLKRYDPKTNQLTIDSKEPNYDLYDQFLDNEIRYSSLKLKDENYAKNILNINKLNAKKRNDYYINLSKKN